MGTINLFNFEAQVISGDILYKVVMICVIIYVMIKVIEVIMKKIEFKEKPALKVLKIKRYEEEVLLLSLMYCILAPTINYIFLFIGIKLIEYDTDIMNKIIGIVLIIEILAILDLLLIAKVNRKINKYNSGIKSKFILISYIICFQYMLLVLIFAIQIFKIRIESLLIAEIWLSVWIISLSLYSIKLLLYSILNKMNIIYHSDRIEVLVKTNHFHKYEFIENIMIKGQIKSEQDNVIIMDNNRNKIRTMKRDWIERINILREDGSVRKSIDKDIIKNTIIDYRTSNKKRLSLKNFKKPVSD